MAAPEVGVGSPTRAQIPERTLRRDRWMLEPAVTLVVLTAFVIYSTWRAFEGAHYYSSPYLSPFYSPCLATSCVEGSSHLGQPFGDWWVLSPALIILIAPLSFRLTCYYYRKTYYRSFWRSPPACAVPDGHSSYSGETRFPLILQNIHRYALYVALGFVVLLSYDAILAFEDPDGGFGVGLGTLILVANAVLLAAYTLSCHSCRHLVGGRLKHFSKHPVRYRLWTWVSKLNPHHAKYAWASLIWVALTDFYVRSLSTGLITDLRFF